MSQPSPDEVTFRWAGETLTQFGGITPGSPANFAATLHKDGTIRFQYGEGNTELASAYTPPGCSPGPTVGISPGHDTFAQTFKSPSYTNAPVRRLDPPFGQFSEPNITLESPAAGDVAHDVLKVKGVAYDNGSPVTRIDVFVDHTAVGTVPPNEQRTDICSTHQDAISCGGYELAVNLPARGFEAGEHQVWARAVNSRGAAVDGPRVSFTLEAGGGEPPSGKIESPEAGAEVMGVLTVKGYVTAGALRVLLVDTLIDGVTYGPTAYNQLRRDICAGLDPAPVNCPGAGFLLSLNTKTALPPISNGEHALQIRVVDESGRFTLMPAEPVRFTVRNGEYAKPAGAVTSPKPGEKLKGVTHVSGYAYSAAPVRNVVLLIDGAFYGALSYGQPAPDACASLQNAACPNIGFSGDFDTRALANGPHVIRVYVADTTSASTYLPMTGSPVISVVVEN